MLDALIECQKNVERNQNIVNETHYLRGHLEEKRSPYLSVATHSAKLYEMVQRVSVLSPAYHMSLDDFHAIFRQMIKERHRGKGVSGELFSFFPLFVLQQSVHMYRN